MTPDRAAGAADGGGTRAGDVALVGRPNVGKSTLLNTLTGERLSIVTPRAQTTRERVMGIYTDERAQLVFVDTPGLLEPSYLFHRSMLEEALTAVREADLVLLLLDATRPDDRPAPEVLELLASRGDALYVGVNKVDAAAGEAVESLKRWSRGALGQAPWLLSAREATGVEELREALVEALPESPFYYPVDEIAVQSVRFFVAEFIRETIFEQYAEELPYSSVVRIEEFREADDPVYIRATIFVERPTQKGIVLGRGGSAIRALGIASREKIEAFVGRAVYLDLWVKVLPDWRKKRGALEYLGYPVPAEDRRDDARTR